MKRACDACGKPYEAKTKTSRYCSSTCRSRASRAGLSGPPTPAAVARAPVERVTGPVEAHAIEELAAVGRLETSRGQVAVRLARAMDQSTADTASALASLARQYEASLEVAMRGTRRETSPLDRARDELARRRARRGA